VRRDRVFFFPLGSGEAAQSWGLCIDVPDTSEARVRQEIFGPLERVLEGDRPDCTLDGVRVIKLGSNCQSEIQKSVGEILSEDE
jgi:hypothetical protein